MFPLLRYIGHQLPGTSTDALLQQRFDFGWQLFVNALEK